MKPRFRSILIFIFLAFFATPTAALINTSDHLLVSNGDSITLAGDVYKNVSIVVESGGVIVVQPADSGQYTGRLNLIAPYINIAGTVNGVAAAFGDRGKGGAPSGKYNGGGGAGYGGGGGRGNQESSGTAGVGGSAYNTTDMEDVGSCGWGASISDSYRYGFGGGAIRLDALELRISGSLLASGKFERKATVGGGSGGCIYLNGVKTTILSTAVLSVSGGRGGGSSGLVGEAGGGGGGRVKFIKYNFTNASTSITYTGGDDGGGNAVSGSNGQKNETVGLMPSAPSLLSPTDNQNPVGTMPTLAFKATDPYNSKFLKYRVELSLDNFSSVSITADQFNPDPGWNRIHYKSGDTASYTFQSDLSTNTQYFWRVWVTNNNVNTPTAWGISSPVWRFTTASAPNRKPEKPFLLFPVNTTTGKIPSFQVLGADPEGNTLTFSVVISKDPQLSNPKVFQATYPGWDQANYLPAGAYMGVTAVCQILNIEPNLDALVPGTQYYWRATVSDSFQQSTDSDIMAFTTVPRPTVPVMLAPPPDAIVTGKMPSLRIQSSSPTMGSLHYKIELSSDDYQTILLFQSQNGGGWTKSSYDSGETAVLTIPQAYSLVPGKTYSWRASSYDIDNDNWSLVGNDQTFTVVTPPLLPYLQRPENQHAAANALIAFQFLAESESGNTMTGRIEISRDQFATVWKVFDQRESPTGWNLPSYASAETMQFTLPADAGLERGRLYWWRAQATNGLSYGPYSEIRSFTLTNQLDVRRLRTIPNPAVSTATIQIQIETSVDAEASLRFFNQAGKEISRQDLAVIGGQVNLHQHDISAYASGVYFYILEVRSPFGSKKEIRKFAVVK